MPHTAPSFCASAGGSPASGKPPPRSGSGCFLTAPPVRLPFAGRRQGKFKFVLDKPANSAYNFYVVQRKGKCALVAQLDRVSDYESEGQGFESLRARHTCGEQVAHRRFFFCSDGEPALEPIFLYHLYRMLEGVDYS